MSGIVELIAVDCVTKSPWNGIEAEECRKEIQLEADIYRTVGHHQRFVKFFGYEPTDGSITLEYMRNGTVRDYLQEHNNEISFAQRFQWTLQATEGLQILHSAGIIHCDFSPRNLLLDANLELKVTDFGGCSIRGSRTLAMGSVRYYLPRSTRLPPSTGADIFALGSTVYEIMTGSIPYKDFSSDQVKQLYELSQFPDLSGVQLSGVIRSCWLLQVESAKQVCNILRSTEPSIA